MGQTLTVSTTGISDDDGLTNVSYSYQWLRSRGTDYAEISGATRSTYTPARVDQGKTLKVKVSFTDDAGYSETLTSAATSTVAAMNNNVATGAPTISGTAKVGQTLTVSTTGISDDDGLTNVSYTYQWIRNDGSNDSNISGATSATYTLADADQGKTIKVKVSFTDDDGNDEELTSAATGSVAAKPNSAATGAPTISGTAQVGQTLTASTSGISDDDGLTDVSYSYQWIANNGTSDTEITDATGSTWSVLAAYEGKTIKVKVSFTDDAGHSEELTSAATDAVSLAVQEQQSNSAATGAPTISGTAQVGQTLTASVSGISDPDGLTNVSYTYQWIRNDGTDDADISGATSSTYTLANDDQGKTIKVKVSFTDDADNDEELTSAATGTVAAQPNRAASGTPTITGTAQVGKTLTASTTGITDADGLTSVSYSYQWIRNDGTDDADISGATSTTYTLVVAAPTSTPTSLTAEFQQVPASHDGTNMFTFRIAFSEALAAGMKTGVRQSLSVSGANVKTILRVNSRRDLFEIKLEPKGADDVSLSLGPSTTDCTANDALCTSGGTALTGTATARVPYAAAAKVAVGDADDVRLLADVTPEQAAAALFGQQNLSKDQLDALDRLGNQNGSYDLGDLLSWINRYQQGQADDGTPANSSKSAPSGALLLVAATGWRGQKRRSPVRGKRRGYALAVLLTATMLWSCADKADGPLAPKPDPGLLTVELSAPADHSDIGILLELEGPSIGTVRAPGLELYQAATPQQQQIVVAGPLRAGTLLQFEVPDRNRLPLYRVRILAVTGEDYQLRDVKAYQAVIKAN